MKKLINNLNVHTKVLKNLLAQVNLENKITQKFWCLYHKLFWFVVTYIMQKNYQSHPLK